ncbi:Mu transposase domain-containing protein [Solibacillus sp. FSL R7-0682]|uniref:Mu transposase domain-containing protein n=1 Tax=Solibacillus sp. FSL R7-0682 TaxID=2921690 RepID=UPI004040C8DE
MCKIASYLKKISDSWPIVVRTVKVRYFFYISGLQSSLLPLPAEKIRNLYRIKHKLVQVNTSSMVSYKANQYSVPTKYIGQKVGIQIHDDQLWIYYNMECIAQHPLSNRKLNIRPSDYKETLMISAPHYLDIDTLAKNNLKTPCFFKSLRGREMIYYHFN